MICELCGDVGASTCPFCLQDVCDACYGWCCMEDGDPDEEDGDPDE